MDQLIAPHRLWAWMIIALLAAGCSLGGRYHGALDESLEIDLRENGSKLFVYRLVRLDALDPGRIQVDRGRTRPTRPTRAESMEPPGRRDYRHLQEDTERALAATGYCREGYFELDRRLSTQVLWIRGECRETATRSDREQFGGLQELSVPPAS